MTVKELIKELENIEDKELQVQYQDDLYGLQDIRSVLVEGIKHKSGQRYGGLTYKEQVVIE